jgi:cytosine/uracil/thiamine/allantoin permease
VEHVAAFWDSARFATSVKIFCTDQTIGLGHVLDAVMVVSHVFTKAHVTGLTMEEVFSAANSANATSITVILFFVLIIVQSTDGAEIMGEVHSTSGTRFLNILDVVTF